MDTLSSLDSMPLIRQYSQERTFQVLVPAGDTIRAELVTGVRYHIDLRTRMLTIYRDGVEATFQTWAGILLV